MEENTFQRLKESIAANAEATEQALAKIFDAYDEDFGVIYDAQRYSLLGGGKRVRPFLVNECARMLGADIEQSMPLACALEMVHTYSLVHDDLPCMDDDDMRRGKESNHKVFGYANALLAGDALLTGAFGVIADAKTLDAQKRIDAVKMLSEAAGDSGMIGGQVMDLFGESHPLEFNKLLKLHTLKTARLMECAVKLGAICSGYGEKTREFAALGLYARNIGIAFQVIDDILDKTSSAEELGKPIGSDEQSGKTTFLTYYTIEEARIYAETLTEEAICAISTLSNSELLKDFAYYLLSRKN